MRAGNKRVEDGTTRSTREKQLQGVTLIQALLDERTPPGGDALAWIRGAVEEGTTGGAYPAISDLWTQLLRKVEKDEPYLTLKERGGGPRPVVRTHPKEITFALKRHIDEAKAERRELRLDQGHFQKYASFAPLLALLRARAKKRKRDAGEEHLQRRNLCFYDHEQVDLFASILRNDCDGRALNTLTLLVITSLYFSLGNRGMSIDALHHGFLSVTRWNAQTWERVTPLVLQLALDSKGDAVDGVMHRQDVMHHRCPARDPISALGHYFAFQFLVAQTGLPDGVDDWLEGMHRRPLLRTLSGGAACVTEFNAELRKYLEEVGADASITFHFFRDVRIAEAGERGDQQHDIVSGAGHSLGGGGGGGGKSRHATHYRSTVRSWVLGGAGYAADPEVQAAGCAR